MPAQGMKQGEKKGGNKNKKVLQNNGENSDNQSVG